MNVHHLAEMANNIADFFKSEPDHKVAVDGIADHISKTWEPRMRKQIIAYRDAGGEELHELVKEALAQLAPAAG